MYEHDVGYEERLSHLLRETENDVEEKQREQILAQTLFHDSHLEKAIDLSQDGQFHLFELERKFLEEKRNKNMGERFALALKPEYLGKIHIVELGMTTNPGSRGALDGLKDDYLDLLDWMKRNDIVKDELQRQESGRTFEMRSPKLPEATSSHIIFTRNRPLIREELKHENKIIRIGIGKRMVFAMPKTTVKRMLMKAESKKMSDSETLNYIESVIIDNKPVGIIPIRTSYLLATDVLQHQK